MRLDVTQMHVLGNDFIVFDADHGRVPAPDVLRALADRHTGIGADGWYLIERVQGAGHHARVRLLNSDGSPAEVSGNGTRCAAAWLIDAGVDADEIRILTGAGLKRLKHEQPKPKRRTSKSKGKGGAVPDAFLDLIQGLDLDGDSPAPPGKN